ncbi:MAG: (d)CMP kinase [Planctomycetes bacterium]|nr:(d)CMP kinase [Planctomycetota bacterium]
MPNGKPPTIITLDGPAGAGKSTLARRLADALGFAHLDSGALYRAVTAALLDRHIDLSDPAAIDGVARAMSLSTAPGARNIVPQVDGREYDEHLRSPEVARAIGAVADRPAVRSSVDAAQRAFAKDRSVVAEGRDEGTVVFPDADWKFYLDADVTERARRRQREFLEQGRDIPLNDVARDVAMRDRRDRERPEGALRIPAGAIRIDTSGRTIEEVLTILRSHLPAGLR